jgi:hypothetical protein
MVRLYPFIARFRTDIQQPRSPPMTPIDPRVEMFQKGQPRDSFFNMKALAPRPMSEATEMFDTDFEDDSEIEDNSPRLSMGSVSLPFSASLHR